LNINKRNHKWIIDKDDGSVVPFDPDIIEQAKNRHLATDLKHQSLPQARRQPQQYYDQLGHLRHDKTNEEIFALTWYQIKYWLWRYSSLCIKSQKIGISTSTLMKDLQYTMLPEGAGKDVLIFSQKERLVQDHILSIKKMLRYSPTFSNYLIEGKTEYLFEEEQTKAFVVYIHNPWNYAQPSRIIGLPSSIPSALSWKRVGRVHMSDVSKLNMIEEKQDEFFAAVFSRLAITGGVVDIETPPSGQQGYIYKLYLLLHAAIKENIPEHFGYFEFPVQYAMDSNIITQEYLDQQLKLFGRLEFDSKYNCKFIAPGNQYFDRKWFQTEVYNTI